MEAVASVVGLLAAGIRVYSALNRLISSAIDAPLLAHTLHDEVRDFRFMLGKLQPYVDGSSSITLLGGSETDVDHLAMTLVACETTFARLEKKMLRLRVYDGRMTAMNRMMWSLGEPDLALLVGRLQQHKTTMTLLLTIWIRCAEFLSQGTLPLTGGLSANP